MDEGRGKLRRLKLRNRVCVFVCLAGSEVMCVHTDSCANTMQCVLRQADQGDPADLGGERLTPG